MASQEYIKRLQVVIAQLHKCESKHVKSVEVNEEFRGQTIWKGTVEVFALGGHPRAKAAFAWSQPEGEEGKKERVLAILRLPPVITAADAVKVATLAIQKEKR